MGYLSAVDEGYMKDLKEIDGKPNDKSNMDLATEGEKARGAKLYGSLASVMRGRALQLVKAVGDSNGLDAWISLKKDLKSTSKARGLAPWEQLLRGQHFQ